MPIEHDKKKECYWGKLSCKPPNQKNFTQCQIVLDLARQTLRCWKLQQPTFQGQVMVNEKKDLLVDLQTDSIALVEPAPRQKVQFCFAVHCLAKVTYFQASGWKEMEDWMQLIKDGSQIKVTQADLNPDRISVVGSYRTEVIGGKVMYLPVNESSNGESSITDYALPQNNRSNSSSQVSEHSGSEGNVNYIIKTGFCTKMGRVRKNWKRRLLVLTDVSLSYYKSEQEKKPLKVIELDTIQDVKLSDSETPKLLMDVVTPNRTFHIELDTAVELHSWIEEIRKQAGLSVMTYL